MTPKKMLIMWNEQTLYLIPKELRQLTFLSNVFGYILYNNESSLT
jgi:hypothetical protein